MNVFFYFSFCLLILIVLLLLVFFISFSFFFSSSENGSPFECGFQSFSGLNFSFSLPFFIISLMFLLFDVEILLLCFYPLVNSFSLYFDYFIWVVIFLILLAVLYEWLKGVLSWV